MRGEFLETLCIEQEWGVVLCLQACRVEGSSGVPCAPDGKRESLKSQSYVGNEERTAAFAANNSSNQHRRSRKTLISLFVFS